MGQEGRCDQTTDAPIGLRVRRVPGTSHVLWNRRPRNDSLGYFNRQRHFLRFDRLDFPRIPCLDSEPRQGTGLFSFQAVLKFSCSEAPVKGSEGPVSLPVHALQAYAEQQVKNYLATARKHQTHPAPHRYISVETFRPTKGQLADYTKRLRQPFPSAPSQLRCLMVFDTQTKQFVGAGCYVVAGEPVVGEIDRFETASAEFVGQGTL
jgi:hypothetical protein